jgi:hypothetical protein
MDEIHAVCDLVIQGFETLRSSQLSARAAIDSGLPGAVEAVVAEALAQWPHLMEMVNNIDRLGRN